MKKILFALYSFILVSQTVAQSVQWIGLKEAFELQKKVPKPILVDVYTDWCGWCKHMEATTYKDPQIINYLNQNFYTVKYNAETKDTFSINGKKYSNPNPAIARSTHQFAQSLGISSYPTTVFYDKLGSTPTVASGALKAEEIAPILVFFGEELSSVIDVNTFSTDFKRTFSPDSISRKQTSKIQWYTIHKGLEKAKKEHKKIWMQAYIDDCITCKVMDSSIYKNEFLVNYISKNYIPIKFNAYTKDSIIIQGKKFINSNTFGNGYHQLLISALQNQKISTPSLLIFDENEQLLAPVSSFLNIRYAEALAVYFKEGKDKEQVSFTDFIQNYKYQSLLSN